MTIQDTGAQAPEQPAPVQEPAFYTNSDGAQPVRPELKCDDYCIPLFYTTSPAAQRQWVGLTLEEIDTVYRNLPSPVFHWQLSRAIEAKLKEKNTDKGGAA